MSQTTCTNELAVVERASRQLPAAGRRRRRDERGAAAVEYAVVTVAAASLGGVLIKILTDPQVQQKLLQLILALIDAFMKVGG
ncbi:DUF4244 domain-containing protein [Enemella evansiae]|uniref:DUF4244 domain-containing protein n=1 Tax=Enemella evansiae TaxID=2016499 RepID=A0A255GJV9_9ACTN|nr:DUF4244 domain-containing protein [Enemella evansiae]PFG65831.1 uncharacterized protein DUF4244 [Propionibacteriaceae bacterium ES.041]OYN98711.1 hypothetical protein CGZ95_12375 [Enemella evansiae]OYN98798.1 hypothetical protein CGZ97_20660 [Enemella evansiae]OYO03309.1 hypothetical protein CGZ96_01425 [Enemella evansiae]OYO13877.1 hypothetical protein CGZ98_04635 [Enemella evansiae]